MKNAYVIDGAVARIMLKNGLVTLIDTDDLPTANSYRGTWHGVYSKSSKSFYVEGNVWENGKNRKVRLHRLLMGNPHGKVVDHFNHDTLDNRRSTNLKAVEHAVNSQNRKRKPIGVYRTHSGKWAARLYRNNKQIHIGVFTNPKAAADAVEAVRNDYRKGATL